MTRDQHLLFCKRCKNREFNPQQGIICGLTKKIADFEGTCSTFILDESVKEESAPAPVVPGHAAVGNLSDQVKDKLRVQQDLVYAIVGGLSAALVGGIIWAAITVTTKYQIGYMAIGVGLLVGFSVRYFGAGIDYIFGVVGAFFALLGCALGNLLSQVAFIAEAESMTYFDVLTLLNPTLIAAIFQESFSPMDVIFYGIAAYEGYKFAFRAIPEELITSASTGKLEPLKFANLRLPIVIVLFVGLSSVAFFIRKGAVGTRTYYYESGAKHYEGGMEYGVENGAWTYWWENGNIQQTGFFKNGKLDSVWTYFNEDGVKYRQDRFSNGIPHGLCEEFFANGKLSGRGPYDRGRQHGQWTYFFEDGSVSQKGFYHLDVPDSSWEVYYSNGKPNAKGRYKRNELVGVWNYWNEAGNKYQEVEYVEGGYSRILNSWNKDGKQETTNGEGTFTAYHATGGVSETGKISGGERVGKWKLFFENGKLQEEGEYRNRVYYLLNAWSPGGKQTVVNGRGTYESYYDTDGAVQETGEIENGLREGEWNILFTDGSTLQRITYVKGKQEGKQESFFAGGQLNVEGTLKENKRNGRWTWYFENGTVESSADYINDLKEGEQAFYDSDGVLLRTEVYKKGERIEVR